MSNARPTRSAEPRGTAWHALPVERVLRELRTDSEGLTAEEAERRLKQTGPNRLRAAPARSALAILADQLRSVVVLLLAVAAAIAAVLGDTVEAAAIAAVLLLNTSLGFVVELRARRAMEALLHFQAPRARVLRDGARAEVDATVLVPGDIVLLEAGDAVPADARLLEAAELQVNEAPITGESLPVEKDAGWTGTVATPLPDRVNLVFAGTAVATGTATAVVYATGMAGEIGRIGGMLGGIREEKTPLEKRLDALGRRLVWITLAVTLVVAALGMLRGAQLGAMLQIAVALGIAAVPEGLPAVATIALAVGLRRMARRRALVRRLHAVEALGSTTVVCTDKTGTLTAGQMAVTDLEFADLRLEVTGAGYAPEGELVENGQSVAVDRHAALPWALRIAALTSRAELTREEGIWQVIGDPTDAALSVLARKGNVDPGALAREWPRTQEVPFSTARRFTASGHESPEGAVWLVKGAPAQVIARCANVHEAAGVRKLDDAGRNALESRNEYLAARGLRVIALAYGPQRDEDASPTDLTFVALAGLMDAPAEGVAETIRTFREAGIRVLMITGDQRGTATAIARDLGITSGPASAIDGSELRRTATGDLPAALAQAGAVSRASPEDKLLIVEALQKGGDIVAMLGDGVNDAAALKRSDVGVAMGRRGTDVAREVASVVLQDDRFATIGAAIEEGRVIYDNIRKFILYLFSCNLAEVMVLFAASAVGLPMPLTALQLLWLNLVTDTFPALALAMEPGEDNVMRRPPRDPRAALLSPAFTRVIVFYAFLIAIVTFAAYVLILRTGDLPRAVTVAFMTLALAQLFHLGNARSTRHVMTPARALANRFAAGAVALVIVLQIAAVYFVPLARVLETVPLGISDWGIVAGLALLPAFIGQGMRLFYARRREGQR